MKKINKIILNKWFNIILLVVSLLLSFVVFLDKELNFIQTTLSMYGRGRVKWFKNWGFYASISIFFNVNYMGHNIGIKNKYLDIAISVACFCGLLTVNVLGMSLLERKIHNITAILFGVMAYFSLLYIFIKGFSLNKIKKINLIMIIVVGVIEIVLMQLWNLTALSEVFLTIAAQGCMLVTNLVLQVSDKDEMKVNEEIEMIEVAEELS